MWDLCTDYAICSFWKILLSLWWLRFLGISISKVHQCRFRQLKRLGLGHHQRVIECICCQGRKQLHQDLQKLTRIQSVQHRLCGRANLWWAPSWSQEQGIHYILWLGDLGYNKKNWCQSITKERLLEWKWSISSSKPRGHLLFAQLPSWWGRPVCR